MNKHYRYASLIAVLLLAALACQAVLGTPTPSETPPPTSPPPPTLPPPPTAVPSPTPSAQPAPSDQPNQLGVLLVSEGDVLNVRAAAGANNPIIDTLAPHATGILPTGAKQSIGAALWREILTPAGTTGWVNAWYLTEVIPAQVFCADSRVDALLNKFVQAVATRDGAALASLVSPAHGLTIRLNWWNPEVNFRGQAQLVNLFSDTSSYTWGVQDGSGLPIQGSFATEVLPLLDDVLNGAPTRHCNDLESGSGASAGMKTWPFEYANVNYIALYRAATPGDEFNWGTWAVGIEYVQGKPYIAFLVHYAWEI